MRKNTARQRQDQQIRRLIAQEEQKQQETLNCIPSENWTSPEARFALSSVLGHKYAEGYPGRRYYPGNAAVDKIEQLCQKRALLTFGLALDTWEVNVQALSGAPANLASYYALVPPGGKIMAMSLDMGGHLSHGQRISMTGKFWTQVPYGVERLTERLNYGEIDDIAQKHRPHLIIAGATAYSRIIDFERFRGIADRVQAHLLVDMAHIAGLIAAGAHPSPFPYADVVTTTTHKTMRGARGALIFFRKRTHHPIHQDVLMRDTNNAHYPCIDRAVFPAMQGGPHMHQIAAIATSLWEMRTAAFRRYGAQVIKNARALAEELGRRGWHIIADGTDNHLFLIDVWMAGEGMGGLKAQDALERAGILANRNTIPFDTRQPMDPSGLRIGTPTLTTRGMKEKEMRVIAKLTDDVLSCRRGAAAVLRDVRTLCREFPLPV